MRTAFPRRPVIVIGVDSSFTVSMSRYRFERAAVALTAVMMSLSTTIITYAFTYV